MRKAAIYVGGTAILLLFIGCTPDLTVDKLEVVWDGPEKKAKAEITNIGRRNAAEFMVYFDGEENPASSNYRPQVRHNIPSLAAGGSIVLEADFAPLARPENNNLENVKKIRLIVDPKDMVKESNENNNEKIFELP